MLVGPCCLLTYFTGLPIHVARAYLTVTDKVIDVVKATFRDSGISITGEGSLDHKTIDENMLIDNVS